MSQTRTDLVHSPEFWFDDGTIVLQVENTLYRVYHGLLASHSVALRDTVPMPKPQTPMEENAQEIEGCRFVKLQGEKERDFTRFLKALHHYGPYAPVPGLTELTSVLRLSDKYGVATLRESMISILHDIYPSSLDKWLTREKAIPPGYPVARQDCITVLNLARKMNIRSILPGAMYLVFTTHALTVLYGGPGKQIDNADDRKRYTLAFPKLLQSCRQAATGFMLREPQIDGRGCDNGGGECDTERIRWLACDFDSGDRDPLGAELPWENFRVCASCFRVAQETFFNERKELWENLPRTFELGTWKDLLA
ncbi:hypothetical protein MSAN_01092800 [Mycena sanguinolenta]|uniref:BTB domain-containing protein n=1 Tax=Mycena sanguinolenta TaxID=230812 RepID=A0A8H6YT03_9AGAR|nr:hypothetical protein MSAN_01092800 [Mycena sanguinolenta]